jgi:hypothetical protein
MLALDMTIRDAQAEVVRTAAANGSLIIKNGSGQALATVALGASPFNAAAGGKIELTAPITAAVVYNGTPNYFEMYTAGSVLILTGSVGVTAGDLLVSSQLFNVGDTFSLDTLAYVAPGV